MIADDRLEILVKACVDEEVRDVALPVDMIARITAPRPPRRRMFSFPVVLAGVATAAVALVVPVALALERQNDRSTAPIIAMTLKPDDLSNRIEVGHLPSGAKGMPGKGHVRFAEHGPDPRSSNVRVWQRNYNFGASGRFPRAVLIRVFSGDITLRKITEQYLTPNLAQTQEVVVSQGQALAHTTYPLPGYANEAVVWQPREGLVIYVKATQFTRAETVKIAKGVTVK
jgi:hypothetical protein